MSIINKINMIAVDVADATTSKAFFTDILGFTAANDYEQGGGRWVTVVPPGGGTTLTLSYIPGYPKQGTHTIYLSTDHVDAAYADVVAKGGKPNGEVSDDVWGKWFSIDDPDGNHWNIVQDQSFG